MDVIATQRGQYGQMRERGDAFTLDSKEAFSDRWMVKANSEEGKAIRAETRGGGLTPQQIAAEEAAATGKADYRAELKAKDAEIAELSKELDALKAKLADRDSEQPAPDDMKSEQKSEVKDEGADKEEVADESTEDAQTSRRRRTR